MAASPPRLPDPRACLRFSRGKSAACPLQIQNTNTFSAEAVRVASSAMVLRLMPLSTSASVSPRASMQVPQSRTCPLPARTPFSMRATFRRLLARLRGHYCVSHQEDRYGDRWIALGKSECDAQAIIGPLAAVGRIVQYQQNLHGCFLSNQASLRRRPSHSPRRRRRSSNSALSISPRAKRSLRISSGVRAGGN